MAALRLRALAGLASALMLGAGAAYAVQPAATLAPDTPEHFVPRTDSFDYVKREVMIPMRDGVKLHTVLVIPKGAHRAPIMLDRTPYNADEATSRSASAHMAEVLPTTFDAITAAGYIVAVQDVRGKYGSEGEYVNERPLRGPLNPTKVDHATDAYDTIDWLVKNTPESNGRVGMIGTSYDGMMVLMAMDDPHPALKAAVPINPVGDTWMGDDDFHGGAFRMTGYDYYYSQDTVRGSGDDLWRRAYDDYDTFLRAGSASDFTREYGMDSLGFPQRLAAHPAYDAYWQAQALDKILATRPHKVPALFVQGQWDQEDIYGAAAVWKATRCGRHRRRRPAGDRPLVPRPGGQGRLGAWADQVRRRHRRLLPPLHPAALPRRPPEGRRAARQARPRHRLRDRNQRVAGLSGLARAGGAGDAHLPAARGRAGLFTRTARRAVATAYVSDPAKPVPYPPAPDQADLLRGLDLEPVAGGRPAHLLRPARRAEFRDRRADRAGAHRGLPAGGAVGVHHGLGQRLGGQADRRLSRRGGQRPQARRATN